MFRLIIILLSTLALLAASAQAREDEYLSEQQLLDLYGDASDELTEAEAVELLRMLCNSERRAAGLAELQPMQLASYMARRHAGEMARLGFSSHYDTQGRNPVQRYNLLGGTDYVQENLILLEINRPLLLTERMVRTFHREWMASEDHRRTILSPQATHTGSDFELYQDGDYYTMAVVSEFICERGDYSRLPDKARSGELLEFSGQLISGVEADYIGIGLQQSPERMSPQQLNELPPYYTLPPESYQIPLMEQLFDGQGHRLRDAEMKSDPANGTFHVSLPVPADWIGQTAYVYLFATLPGDEEMRCIACQTVEITD